MKIIRKLTVYIKNGENTLFKIPTNSLIRSSSGSILAQKFELTPLSVHTESVEKITYMLLIVKEFL